MAGLGIARKMNMCVEHAPLYLVAPPVLKPDPDIYKYVAR